MLVFFYVKWLFFTTSLKNTIIFGFSERHVLRQTPFKPGYIYYPKFLIFIFFDDQEHGRKSSLWNFLISNYLRQELAEGYVFVAVCLCVCVSTA